MANMNFESKTLEEISTKIGQDAIKGMTPYFVEAVEQGFSAYWEDIFKAVIAAQAPVQNVVSDDKLVQELQSKLAKVEAAYHDLSVLYNGERDTNIALMKDNTELRETIMDLELELAELRVAFKQVSPERTEEPVEPSEPAGEEQVNTFVNEAVEKIMGSSEADIDMKEDELPDFGMEEKELEVPEIPAEPEPEVSEVHVDPFTNIGEMEDPFAGVLDFDTSVEEPIIESSANDFGDLASLENELNSLGGDLTGEASMELPAAPQEEDAPVVNTLPAAPKTLDVKNSKELVTYDVLGAPVHFLRKNVMIKDLANGDVRRKALSYNTVMMQGNPRKGFSEDDQAYGRFFTQMIREYALEIAAFNQMAEPIEGDSGAAVLVARMATGELHVPTLRFRDDEERVATANIIRDMNDAAKRKGYIDMVKGYLASLPLSPDAFVAEKETTEEIRILSGYALLYARLTLTWTRTADKKKRVVNVFSEIKKSNI